MSFPAYPSYQDSGVAWLGPVPSHWEVAPLKRLLDIQNGADHKHVQQEDGYPVIGSGGQFTFASDYLFDGESVLLGRKGTIDKPLHVTGRFWTVDTMYWSKIRSGTNGRFVYYTATTIPFGFYSTSTALPSITQTALNGHLVARPPFTEQVAIAAFLDRETAKIDALIEEQRRLIALLKEKRQAVISHAVTKGLDPHAPMKDSGIEWLGEVPAHWTVKPLKRIGVFNAGAGFPHDEQGIEGEELSFHKVNALGKAGPDGVLPISDDSVSRETANRLRAFIFPAGSIVFAKIGAALLLGRIRQLNAPACLDNNMMGLIVCDPNNADFIRYLMTLVRFDLIANPGTVPSLNEGQIANVVFAFPPPAEQGAIAGFLRSQLARFDALMAEAGKAIHLLNERRVALISAAVTGKIDVRGSAKVLPFPIDRARARGLIATEIIERSAHQATFGRVKFQKIAFLTEAHVGISELAGSYTREAAGPLDRVLIEEMESAARSIAGIEHEQPGGAGTTVSYRLGQQRGAHRQELAQWLGEDRTAKLDKLIGDFAALSTKEAEAVATLYGVWNDALSQGASPSDDEIISGFLNDWHPEKRAKFRASELPEWLGWMRRHGIVPTGSGPKTTTGRLFV